MILASNPERVVVDRSCAGELVTLISTSDPRRSHLEGLTGIVKARALGVTHVEWSNGEHFAINDTDRVARS